MIRVFMLCFLCVAALSPCAHAEGQRTALFVDKFHLDKIKDVSKLLVLDTSAEKPLMHILKRFQNQWICIRECQADIGYGGVTDHKIEGDHATPKGLFDILMAFGTHEDHHDTILPYYEVKAGDVWGTDPNSKYYNLFVRKNTVFQDWQDQIELSKRTVRYHHAFVIDYNVSHKKPYKGSAIFIQCSIGKATDGSIALPCSVLEELHTFVDSDTKIYIP